MRQGKSATSARFSAAGTLTVTALANLFVLMVFLGHSKLGSALAFVAQRDEIYWLLLLCIFGGNWLITSKVSPSTTDSVGEIRQRLWIWHMACSMVLLVVAFVMALIKM